MTDKKKRIKTPRAGRGALLIVGGLFALSAIARLGSGTGQAIARELTVFDRAEPEQHALLQCENPEEIAAILEVLRGRQSEMEEQERFIAERTQSLAVAEEQIRQNLAALELAEERLSQTIATSETAAESDLARLTAVYENMKPKDAATLFEEMDPEFAAGFFGRMRPDAAAQIMTGLSPQTAYSVSVILAGRNANAPKE